MSASLTGRAPAVELWPKTIHVSGQVAPAEYRKMLKQEGYGLSSGANDLLQNPAFTSLSRGTSVRLRTLLTSELCRQSMVPFHTLMKRVRVEGLGICVSAIGPESRLNYRDQPKGESLMVVMTPLKDSHGILRIFMLNCDEDGTQWLRTLEAHDDTIFSPSDRLIVIEHID